MPNKNTFQIQPIKELIEKYYQPNELWLNPFANTSKYGITGKGEKPTPSGVGWIAHT